MLSLILLFFVASAVRVYKKTSPNGRMTVYLPKRDFVDRCDGNVDPVEGVVFVEKDYLKGRQVYGVVTTIFRYGREEDEVMGVKFSKEMVLCKTCVVPTESKEKLILSRVLQKLLEKLGENAFPFSLKFPPNAPSSVALQTGEGGKALGIEYRVSAIVGDGADDPGHKRSTVNLIIKKLQYAPPVTTNRLPSSQVTKGFTFSSGKVCMEVTLDREIYFHGEQIAVTLAITNNSKKSVRNIKLYVMQHVELTISSTHLSKAVASLETKEGCPVTPGTGYSKVFFMVPLASSNKDKRGIALDGYLKDDDVNLASSTLIAEGKGPQDATGIVISYTVKAKISFGSIGGELQTDLPMKLVFPASGSDGKKPAASELKRMKTVERIKYEGACYAEEADDVIFEDFAKTRRGDEE